MMSKNTICRAPLLFAGLITTVLMANDVFAAQFLGGPSVRVNPGTSVEIKWITDAAWFGKVEVFNVADGTGTPIFAQKVIDAAGSPVAATQQTVTINVA